VWLSILSRTISRTFRIKRHEPAAGTLCPRRHAQKLEVPLNVTNATLRKTPPAERSAPRVDGLWKIAKVLRINLTANRMRIKTSGGQPSKVFGVARRSPPRPRPVNTLAHNRQSPRRCFAPEFVRCSEKEPPMKRRESNGLGHLILHADREFLRPHILGASSASARQSHPAFRTPQWQSTSQPSPAKRTRTKPPFPALPLEEVPSGPRQPYI